MENFPISLTVQEVSYFPVIHQLMLITEHSNKTRLKHCPSAGREVPYKYYLSWCLFISGSLDAEVTSEELGTPSRRAYCK